MSKETKLNILVGNDSSEVLMVYCTKHIYGKILVSNLWSEMLSASQIPAPLWLAIFSEEIDESL